MLFFSFGLNLSAENRWFERSGSHFFFFSAAAFFPRGTVASGFLVIFQFLPSELHSPSGGGLSPGASSHVPLFLSLEAFFLE